MRQIKTGRFITVLFGILGGIFAFIALLAFILFVFRPSWLINNNLLPLIQSYLSKRGISLTWQEANLSIESKSKLTKSIHFYAKDLQVKALPIVDFSSEVFESSATVSFRRVIPKVESIGPIILTKGIVKHSSSPQEQTSKKNSEILPSIIIEDLIPRWLKKTTLTHVDLEVVSYDLILGDFRASGSARLIASPILVEPPNTKVYTSRSHKNNSLEIKLTHHTEITKTNNKLSDSNINNILFGSTDGVLQLFSTESVWEGPFKISLVERAIDDKGVPLNLQINLQDKPLDHLAVNLNAFFGRKPGKHISIKANGTYRKNKQLDATVNAEAREWIEPFSKIALRQCMLHISKINLSSLEHLLDLNCPVQINANLPAELREFPKDLVGTLDLLVTSKLKIGIPLSLESSIKGDIDLSISPLKNRYLQGDGGIKVVVDGTLKKVPDSLNSKTFLDATLNIPEFKNIVERLKNSPKWAIPGPFNSLHGSITTQVSASADVLPWNIKNFPISISSSLFSNSQKLHIKGNGQIDLANQNGKSHTSLVANVSLNDIALVLPHMELGNPPRFLLDQRIKVEDAPLKQPTPATSVFHYDLMFETKDKPIRLFSNLAKKEIPVSLKLHLQDSHPVQLNMKVAKFPIDLFRRDAQLEHFIIRNSPTKDVFLLDGRALVTYTDYRIIVTISGTDRAPIVTFNSEPPLSDSQMIAALLFGKPIEQLEPGQSESVNSAQVAIMDGAISLASMYLLASTPIESIGYDSISKVMTAKVRLVDGTSLNIGSNLLGINSLGIRKRLGPNWSISTYLENPFDSSNRRPNAFVEWNRRY